MPYYPDPHCNLCDGRGKREITYGEHTCVFVECDCLMFIHSPYCPAIDDRYFTDNLCNCRRIVDYGDVIQRTKR